MEYAIKTTFEESFALDEVIGLADNQILRSIRDIRKRVVNKEKIERLHRERAALIKRCEHSRHSLEYVSRIKWIKEKINRTMFIPDYVTVVMEHKKHYERIFNRGVEINGEKYVRFSCSAGQARVSTVVLCNESIVEELERRLNNGRDLSRPITPSKFNAYFGLAGSATREVSDPRFIVVRDYKNIATFMANFITEREWDTDDEVDQREVSVEMNRTDGMGLITPQQAEKWAQELELGWVPGQWIIRQSFIKGMLCTFPIQEFCEAQNGGSYLVDTVYKDEAGEYVKADLREVDVILSESQFKLWDSYQSQDQYIRNCKANKLVWGVSQYSPERGKDILDLNYQFIQTLKLNAHDVEALSEQFVNWIEGVSFKRREYMLLFLLGVDNPPETIKRFLSSSDKWWIKALMTSETCAADPYIRSKTRELVQTRIKNACMGEIFVDGNFQMMVSDPYAYMQHVCGQNVTGLLREGEFYSSYWNRKDVRLVDSMRSPLTYRSEHVLANLVMTADTERWYRFCPLGFILNWWGHDCVNYAGSDFDGDIIATTSNPTIIKGVYTDDLPVVYDPPAPEKKICTKEDLYVADTFGFGSIIGSITNKGSNGFALLPLLVEKYGEDSREVKTTLSRLQQCCKAQSAQIDKCKIGKAVKGIPSVWITRQKVEPDDTDAVRDAKAFNNAILLDRYPYFFIHRYPNARKAYNAYEDKKQSHCNTIFGLSIAELKSLKRKTRSQKKWLREYEDYKPLVDSDAPVNLLCHHIESTQFEIMRECRNHRWCNWEAYMNPDVDSADVKEDIVKAYRRYLKDQLNSNMPSFSASVELLKDRLRYVCSDPFKVTNALIRYLYQETPKSKKELLWGAYGRYIVANLGREGKGIFPTVNEAGEIEYLGRAYQWTEVERT